MPPKNWQRLVTPEGNVYYYDELRVSLKCNDALMMLTNIRQRIYTISNIYLEDECTWIDFAFRNLDFDKELDLPEDMDVVLDYSLKGYYLTSLSSKCIFWLEDVESDMITGAVREVLSEEHLGMRFLIFSKHPK